MTDTQTTDAPTDAPTDTPQEPVVLDHDACAALLACCSDDVSRPTLNYAHVVDGAAEATDGHILSRRALPPFQGDWLIHRDTLKLVRVGGRLEVYPDTGALTLLPRKGPTAQLPPAVSPVASGMIYPDTKRVTPEYAPEDGVRFALSGKYLRVLADIAKREGGTSNRMILHVNTPERGITWTCGGASGVVMPLRVIP